MCNLCCEWKDFLHKIAFLFDAKSVLRNLLVRQILSLVELHAGITCEIIWILHSHSLIFQCIHQRFQINNDSCTSLQEMREGCFSLDLTCNTF